MAVRWAITGGSWSNISTWNDGATLGIPTSADDVFTNGFTILVDTGFTVNSLNNTARVRDIATPQMTANNVPSPYVAAASNTNGATQPFQIFDRNLSNSLTTSNTVLTLWASIDFGSGNSIVIDGYTVWGSSTQSSNPRNWTFEGSNNNVSWTTLHTVTLPSAIATSSNYSIASIGNTTSYRYYRINITLNGGGTNVQVAELELYQPGTSSLAAGGSFNFNTAGVTANITGTTPINMNPVSGTFSLITAPNGLVTINFTNNVIQSTNASNTNFFNHTGSCDLVLNGSQFIGTNLGGTGIRIITKSSLGTLTIIGNIVGASNGGGLVNNDIINSSNGNTIIIGNVIGGSNASPNRAITQTSGNLTITGNVTGGSSSVNNQGILFSGVRITVNGNAIGGTGASAIDSSSQIFINGDVIGGSAAAITSSSSILVTVSGNVSASTTANGISLTNASSQVYLNGNMFNVNGKMAIYAPIVWLNQTGTTQARFFTSGGADRTLYSENTFPNQPLTSDVRYLTQFGPSSGLTGTLRMASPSDVRSGVATDNTVGTALFDTSQLLAELNASSDPIAQRLRKVATPEILGQLLAAYKK